MDHSLEKNFCRDLTRGTRRAGLDMTDAARTFLAEHQPLYIGAEVNSLTITEFQEAFSFRFLDPLLTLLQ